MSVSLLFVQANENTLFLAPAGKRCEFMLTAAKGLLASTGPVPFWYSKSMGVSWWRLDDIVGGMSVVRRGLLLWQCEVGVG